MNYSPFRALSQVSALAEAWFSEYIGCEIELIYVTCPHGATHTMQMLYLNTSKHQATHMHYTFYSTERPKSKTAPDSGSDRRHRQRQTGSVWESDSRKSDGRVRKQGPKAGSVSGVSQPKSDSGVRQQGSGRGEEGPTAGSDSITATRGGKLQARRGPTAAGIRQRGAKGSDSSGAQSHPRKAPSPLPPLPSAHPPPYCPAHKQTHK